MPQCSMDDEPKSIWLWFSTTSIIEIWVKICQNQRPGKPYMHIYICHSLGDFDSEIHQRWICWTDLPQTPSRGHGWSLPFSAGWNWKTILKFSGHQDMTYRYPQIFLHFMKLFVFRGRNRGTCWVQWFQHDIGVPSWTKWNGRTCLTLHLSTQPAAFNSPTRGGGRPRSGKCTVNLKPQTPLMAFSHVFPDAKACDSEIPK